MSVGPTGMALFKCLVEYEDAHTAYFKKRTAENQRRCYVAARNYLTCLRWHEPNHADIPFFERCVRGMKEEGGYED